MNTIESVIGEYRQIQAQQYDLEQRRQVLRQQIISHLSSIKANFLTAPTGVAVRSERFKLHPQQDPVLGLLSAADILSFANFTSKRVTELLVPKYTRERLMPLFKLEKS